MSNLGFQTVYRLFNAQDDIVCERVFLPPKQELAELLAANTPLLTLESQTPVGEFDVLAFSVSFEWDYVNVLTLLRLAGIPALRRRAHRAPSADRDRRRGDVRQPRAAGAVCRRDRRRRGRSARARARARVPRGDRAAPTCCAVCRGSAASTCPSFYEPQYAADGSLTGYRASRQPDAPFPVRKAAVKTTDALDPPATSIFTPDTEFGSRFLVEVVRGCANLCRFCWAGYNYLPVRAFPADRILRARRRGARRTRSRVGLVSIALCDHPEIDRILARLLEMGYAISPASLRLDDLTESIVQILRASGERGITIAPETGSDRLRRVINKTVTNDEILDRAELIFANGIENLKLYYMIGLPTETDEDLVAIRDLTLQMRERMLKHARASGQIGRIVGSVNPLIPKPGTAYQWLPMEDPAIDRPEDQAAAQPDGRHRQRVLQHQVGTALLLPGAALARRSPRRAGDRGGRAQRPELARRGRRSRRRRGLLHLPRPEPRRRAALGHHRRRHEDVVLPGRVREVPSRGMDASAETPAGERAAAADVVSVIEHRHRRTDPVDSLAET